MTLLFSKLIFTFLLSYLIKTEKIINILYSPWANIYSSLANIYSPWLIIYSPRLNKKITYTSTSNTNKPKGGKLDELFHFHTRNTQQTCQFFDLTGYMSDSDRTMMRRTSLTPIVYERTNTTSKAITTVGVSYL